MRVYNEWREIVLNLTGDTIVQNLTGLTLMIKFGVEPVDDTNSIYIGYRTSTTDGDYRYENDKGKMWVKILENLDDLENVERSNNLSEDFERGIRRYITVINDEPHYNGFEIKHGAGLMDFSITNATYVFWELADGTTSTLARPAVTLPAGTSILYADFYKNDIELSDNGTNANYIGDLKDLPNLSYYANFSNTNVSGDISSLSNLSYYASFYNTNVSGDISSLSNITYLASFYSTNVTGDISSLSNITNYANFHSTNVSGILNPHATLKSIYLHNTLMTSNDTDQTIINLRNDTTITSGGTLQIKANRTSISDEAFDYLTLNGWTITEV